MKDAKSAALRYVLLHYGNLVSVGDPVFESDSRTWVTHIRTDYPRIIENDSHPGAVILKYMSINDLGVLRLAENFGVVEATSREECTENLLTFLKVWRDRAENIVVSASADQIARIAETQSVLNPILKIVSNLLKRNVVRDEEVKLAPRRERMKQYLKLLEDLRFVQRIEGGYTYGNLLVALQERTSDIVELETSVLSHVLKTSYPTLRDIFNISQVERFVHVDSCYYTEALEAGDILHLKRESIVALCRRFYEDTDSLGITQILDKLVRVNALQYSDPFYSANERLFSEMLEMKNSLPDLASPTGGIALTA